jgi:hypothetical protein
MEDVNSRASIAPTLVRNSHVYVWPVQARLDTQQRGV